MRNWKRMLGIAALSAVLLLLGCQGHRQGGARPGHTGQPPKLVVGIVVDQMRYDYLERFWANFGEGGFKRLVTEGTAFSDCNYNYVPTETAPGHASIFTGAPPAVHGIIMNAWIDHAAIAGGTAEAHSSVIDNAQPFVGIPARPRARVRGASPSLLLAPTIADQLKEATGGKSLTIGVSLKDRSAILPAGHRADAAYWFDGPTGHMISSQYYPLMRNGLPAWLDSLNALKIPRRLMSDPAGWNLLLPADRYTTSDGPEDARYEGTYSATGTHYFPHIFKIDTLNCCGHFSTTAWGNAFVKDVAKLAVQRHALGLDSITDFLSVSFSATDMVAHQFGPQSREVEDTYIRLDRDLKDLLDFLDARLGKGNVLIFLTADHGGAANPDYALAHGEKAGWLDMEGLHQRIRAQLGDEKGKDSLLYAVQGHNIYLNRALAARRSMNLDSLRQVVKQVAQAQPGIIGAFTATELAQLKPKDWAETCLQNGFHPDRGGDVLLLEGYGYMDPPFDRAEPWRYQKGTTHGTHYDYDTHVPLLFWGWGVPAKKNSSEVVIPDIAPTVCKHLGIAPSPKSTGKAVKLR